MTAEQARILFQYYAKDLGEHGVHPVNEQHPTLAHCAWMCSEAQTFDSLPKVMRWLGYVQGVLSALGLFTIAELRNHSFHAIAGKEPPA